MYDQVGKNPRVRLNPQRSMNMAGWDRRAASNQIQMYFGLAMIHRQLGDVFSNGEKTQVEDC
jgi:hypothetical protein